MNVGLKAGLLLGGTALAGAVTGYESARMQESKQPSLLGVGSSVVTTGLAVGTMAAVSSRVSIPALAGVGLVSVGVATAAMIGAHELGTEARTNADYPAHL